MLRPITYAPRGRISQPVATPSASFARGSPMCQACSSRPRMPSGFSRLWSGPATKPSSEIDMWQVVSDKRELLNMIKGSGRADASSHRRHRAAPAGKV